MSNTTNELATGANTVTIMVGSFLNMDQMIPSGVVPGLVANGAIGLDALVYDMAADTYNGGDLVSQLASVWAGAGSGTQETTEYSGLSTGTIQLTNTTGAAIAIAAQGAIFTATDGRTYGTVEQPNNAAWTNNASQTGAGSYVVAPGQTISVPIEATFQGDDPGSDAAGSITGTGIAGLVASQTEPLSPGGSYTDPENNTQGGWLSNAFGEYGWVMTGHGLSPAEAHVNIAASFSWSAADVASWDGYVDHSRAVGILNVAPLQSGTISDQDPTEPFATSSFFAGYRAAAMYGGGFEIEQPSYYWFALSPSQQQTTIEELRWCNANGLRSSLLINNQMDFAGDPDPNFISDTLTMLRQMQAEGALPGQIVLENDNTTSIGSYYDANPSDLTSLNAVAIDLANDFSFTPSASEAGLEVRGTSAAQTTLIMTGVAPTENIIGGAFAPYANASIFGESATETLTLAVTDTAGRLALADSDNASSTGAGGTLTFNGTAAAATTFLRDLSASEPSGAAGIAHLTLTLTDDLGETTQGLTNVYLGVVHPVFTSLATQNTGPLSPGQTITYVAATSAPVSVSGAPELLLTNNRWATYAGKDGAGDLLFTYGVTSGDGASDLRVRGLRLDGASIVSVAGGLAIDPDSIDGPEEAMASPAVQAATGTIVAVSEQASAPGAILAGETVTLSVSTDAAVVSVTGGTPSLALNNGAVATYAGLSPSGVLLFTTTIPAGGVSNGLAPTALHLNGASLYEKGGVTVTVPATLPTPGYQIIYDTRETVLAVAETTAVGRALAAGDTVTFTLSTTHPIASVAGAPTLALNNDRTATYAGLTNAGQLRFTTIVPADATFSGLEPIALSLAGAIVTDDTGLTLSAPASMPAPVALLSYNTSENIVAVTETGSVAGTLHPGDTATFALAAARPVATVLGSPTLVLDDGGTATYAGLTSTGALRFTYAVPATGSFTGLAPTTLNLNGAVVIDTIGATLSPPAGLPTPAAALAYAPAGITTSPGAPPGTGTPPSTSNGGSVPSTSPSGTMVVIDGVPIPVPAGTAIGAVSPVSGAAVQFSFGGGTVIADPSGNAEVIDHLYQAVLGRSADLGGLETWLGAVDAGSMSLTDAGNDMASSAEFASRYGALGNAAFVQLLAENTTGSPASASDQAFVNLLDAGVSRGSVAMQFAESSKNVLDALGTSGDSLYGEVYRLYETTLGRAPDVNGLGSFMAALQQGTPLAGIVDSFINSPEFLNDFGVTNNTQFVTALYKDGLGRAPDPTGLSTWVGALNGGTTRENVVLAISNSGEERADTALATHDNWLLFPG